MFAIPFDRFEIQTGLTPAEIQQRLSGILRRKRPKRLPLGPNPETYAGKVREDGFPLARWIS
jgi:hypothetical protein